VAVGDDEHARVAWGLIAEPGDRYAGALINHEGPVDALQRVQAIQPSAMQAFFRRHDLEDPAPVSHFETWKRLAGGARATESLRLQHSLDIWMMTPDSPLWPAGLVDLGPYQPHTLWFQGDPSTFAAPSSWLGVVGSRQSTPQGIRAAQAIVHQVAADQRGIISGGALGIDAAAHHTALEVKVPQIAVLAGGLDRLYPGVHRELFRRIKSSGVLVSEAPCTVPHQAHRFLHRNRLIAALSHAVVVVEAAWRSGAVNTARHAAALGRGLGVVPGRWEDEQSAGCFRSVRDASAIVLSEPGDVQLLFSSTARVRGIQNHEKGTTVFG